MSNAVHGSRRPQAPFTDRIFLALLAVVGAMALRRGEARDSAGGTRGATIGPRPGERRPVPGEGAEKVVTEGASRGRTAQAPHEIPAAGWKDILLRTWHEAQKDRLVAVAAGVTFYSLLAIFPAIGALVSLYGLFADPSTISQHLNALSGVLPGGAMQVIGDQVSRIASQPGGRLGFTFALGLVISLWSANSGMKAVFDALNVVYDEEEQRSFIKLNAISMLFTLGAIVLVLLVTAAVVVVPVVLAFIGLGTVADIIVRLARWPIMLVVIAVALAALYRWGPSREEAKWRWVTWGSGFASVAWVVASVLFSWYAANFGKFNATYGSLGAVIGFMFWLWISAIVILVGAELNAEIEHQTAADSTTGRPRPLGSRGATMADTVGSTEG